MTSYFIKAGSVPDDTAVIPIHICRPKDAPALLANLSPAGRTYAKAHRFNGGSGQAVLVPDDKGNIALVLFGVGQISDGYSDSALQIGALAERLRPGFYEISSAPDDMDNALMAVAWGLGTYKFNRYLKQTSTPPTLVLTDNMRPDETTALVAATHRGRDLINTPASDMGPKALHLETKNLAETYGAAFKATVGKNLLKDNYPMIHAVGRAAHEKPRLLEFTWAAQNNVQDAPSLAIIGKGVTFDSGGVNMKSAAGMRIMKKDMGGAAHALALAEMIMAANLPVRLHVLLAVAENSVSGNAFRPGDILSSRKGLTVEIDNTDAEGRLVLGDALTRASEEKPDLIMDFATLTGAARVALGPTLVPFFSNRKAPIDVIMASADGHKDPLWPMPLWAPYMRMLSSPIADMKNVANSFAGCITAALFLEKFIGKDQAWMHFDVYGWNQNANPARPKGGEIFAVRGLYHWLKDGGLKDGGLTKMRD
ncbi:MAG: leucyl aminopeptidase family protein [Robiginitomaculum sp.]|nr:leucyl aminopeptidase family protein [Robiginitomaculum sp.]